MKILHLPSTFFPDYIGGKEVLVYSWIKHTQSVGITHEVLLHGDSNRKYSYQGIEVEVIPKLNSSNPRHSYFDKIYDDLSDFENVLNEYQPDIVHFHDISEGASLSHLRICKEKSIKTILTYHSPGQSCMQHGLLFAGKQPCDGKIEVHRCTSCRYQEKGLPALVADAAAFLRLPFDQTGKIAFRKSTELFYKSWREFYDTVDVVHVYSDWVREMMLINEVDAAKIFYTRMGGSKSLNRAVWRRRSGDDPLRLVFIGRCTPIKGIHLLIDAVKRLPINFSVEVNFFGTGWDTSYGLSLKQMIADDLRFKSPRTIPPSEVVLELSKMDICVVPSLWPETGPLTVFDAFAAGLPVIGTRYAGIADKVVDGVNGLLFNWGDSTDLEKKIRQLLDNPQLVEDLKMNISENYSTEEFSEELKKIYVK